MTDVSARWAIASPPPTQLDPRACATLAGFAEIGNVRRGPGDRSIPRKKANGPSGDHIDI
jgi:hypothetical protein